MHTEVDKAYLAGLLDGEGHIGITLRSGEWRGHQVIVKITNTEQAMLGEIAEQYGAHIQKQRVRHGWKPTIDIHWAANKAINLLREVQPYLRIKSRQCAIALKFAETVKTPNAKARATTKEEWDYREQLRLEIRKLNLRSKAEMPTAVAYAADKHTQVCASCGKTFIGTRKRKYCSDYCRHKESNNRVKSRNVRKCLACGKEFAGQPHQKYCSHSCSQPAVGAIRRMHEPK